MIRQTGGLAMGATSTRSRSASLAMTSASGRLLIPNCAPSASIRRTSRALIRSLLLVSAAVPAAMRHHSLVGAPDATRAGVGSNARPRRPFDPAHPTSRLAGWGPMKLAPLPVLGLWLGYQR